MSRRLVQALPAVLAMLLGALPLAAQSPSPSGAPASSTKGFFIGAHLNGSALTADELGDESESGAGFGLQLGYGFTPRLALVVDGTRARLGSGDEEYGLDHLDVLVRYAFTGPSRRFVPFLELGYAGRSVTQEDVEFVADDIVMRGDFTYSGSSVSLGGGAQWYASPKVAIGLGLRWTTGELDRVVFDMRDGNELRLDFLATDATTTRAHLGVTWYPMAGRSGT